MENKSAAVCRLSHRKGLRAIMIAAAVLAMACVALVCVPSLTDPAGVSARAHAAADRILPVMFRYTPGVSDADAEGVIVSSGLFSYERGEVTAIEGVAETIGENASVERLPAEQQSRGAWRANRFWFRVMLLAPWIGAALLLLAVFGLIGAVVSRELRTLEEVAQALEEESHRTRERIRTQSNAEINTDGKTE